MTRPTVTELPRRLEPSSPIMRAACRAFTRPHHHYVASLPD